MKPAENQTAAENFDDASVTDQTFNGYNVTQSNTVSA